MSARHAEPPDRSNLVEIGHEIGDRRVDVRQAVKDAVTQPPEQPSLDDQDRLLDLGLALSGQLQFVSGRPGLQFASRIPSTRLSGSRSSLSAAARTGAKTV